MTDSTVELKPNRVYIDQTGNLVLIQNQVYFGDLFIDIFFGKYLTGELKNRIIVFGPKGKEIGSGERVISSGWKLENLEEGKTYFDATGEKVHLNGKCTSLALFPVFQGTRDGRLELYSPDGTCFSRGDLGDRNLVCKAYPDSDGPKPITPITSTLKIDLHKAYLDQEANIVFINKLNNDPSGNAYPFAAKYLTGKRKGQLTAFTKNGKVYGPVGSDLVSVCEVGLLEIGSTYVDTLGNRVRISEDIIDKGQSVMFYGKATGSRNGYLPNGTMPNYPECNLVAKISQGSKLTFEVDKMYIDRYGRAYVIDRILDPKNPADTWLTELGFYFHGKRLGHASLLYDFDGYWTKEGKGRHDALASDDDLIAYTSLGDKKYSPMDLPPTNPKESRMPEDIVTPDMSKIPPTLLTDVAYHILELERIVAKVGMGISLSFVEIEKP